MGSTTINTKFSKVLFLILLVTFILLLSYTIHLGISGNIIFSYQPIVLSDQVVRGSVYSSDKKIYSIETAKYKLKLKEGISVNSRKQILDLINFDFDNISEKTKNKIENIDKNYTEFKKYYVRQRPQEKHLELILGSVGKSLHGESGIEKLYDENLSKEPKLNTSEILYGDNLYLSVNSNLQYVCDNIVKSNGKNNKVDSILALVVDNDNGGVKALCSYNISSLEELLNKQYSYGDYYSIIQKPLQDANLDRFSVSKNKNFNNPRDNMINIFSLARELTSLSNLDSNYKDISLVDYAENDKGMIIYNKKQSTDKNSDSDKLLNNIINNDLAINNNNYVVLGFRSYHLDTSIALAPSSSRRYSIITFIENKNQTKDNLATLITENIAKNVFYMLDLY